VTRAVVATIDTGALTHNLALVRRIAPQSRVMAVIKANGYGHGLLTVAQALAGADGFAVAHLEEGVALREAGFAQRILLLQGVCDTEGLAAARQHQLDLVVHERAQIDLLSAAPAGRPVAVWVKLDTGMQRLGFPLADVAPVAGRLEACAAVRRPLRWMSHLANADDRWDPLTTVQIERFLGATAGRAGERSLANSAGLLHWPQAQLDWVRPGIMLYGVSPFEDAIGANLGLHPVMRLEARLIALRRLQAGDRVGYGGTWQARRDTTLGIAGIGYGDGYPRHAPSGTPVMVNGRAGVLAGRVSMDMISIDLSEQPARLGEPVEVWGPALPVEIVARRAETIPYELLAGMTGRVRYRVESGTDRVAQLGHRAGMG
jgi:alanine racemase